MLCWVLCSCSFRLIVMERREARIKRNETKNPRTAPHIGCWTEKEWRTKWWRRESVLPSQSITFLLLLHFVLSFTSPLVPFAFKLITNEVRELNLKAKQTRTWWMSCSFVFLLLTWMVMKCNVSTHSSEKKKNTKRTTENTTFFVSFIRLFPLFVRHSIVILCSFLTFTFVPVHSVAFVFPFRSFSMQWNVMEWSEKWTKRTRNGMNEQTWQTRTHHMTQRMNRVFYLCCSV